MRWRLAWLSAVLWCGCVLGAQTSIPVTAIWDLDPSHDAPGLTWELERDGVIHPCGSVTVTATERRCSATVPALAGTYRLRGVTASGEPGPWSVEGSGTQTAPGAFVITWHSAITLTEPEPGPTMELSDNFDADSSADWTSDGFSAYNRDAANGELDQSSWDNFSQLRYSANPPGDIEHEAQVTLLSGSGRAVGPGCRLYSGDDNYGISLGSFGELLLFRHNAAARTSLTQFNSTHTNGNFVTVRMACEGGNGANVVISIWVVDHGASKPSDPGWIGDDGAPDYTYTDSAASRLDDDTQHLYVGFAGRGFGGYDTRCDYWKGRAISDRAGGGADAAGDLAVGAPTLAASVTVARTASAALTVPGSTLAGSATIPRSASGALIVPPAGLTAAAAVARAASGAMTVPASTLAAAATVARTVAVALVVPVSTLAADVEAGRTVSGALVMPAATFAAAADRVVEAAGALAVPAASLTAAVAIARTADGSLVLAVPVLAGGVTTEVKTVTAALVSPMPVLDADVLVSRTAIGTLSMSGLVLDGDATRVVEADGLLVLTPPTLAAQIAIARLASGDLDLPALVATAEAVVGVLQPVMLTRADVVSLTPVRDVLSLTPARDVIAL